MGGMAYSARNFYAPPMVISEIQSGAVVGVVASNRLPGDIASFLIFLDPDHGRAPHGMEATALYVSHLFDSGARLVMADVLAFNPVNRLLQRVGLMPQARLREHVYAAGRFWDVLVYSFDRDEWLAALGPFLDRMPGGKKRPSALGGRRSPKAPLPRTE
jgi:RimJ/RimL family protein N-acetyltransferase